MGYVPLRVWELHGHELQFLSSGDIVSISVLSQGMIIVNSAKTAVEILDRKGSIYSESPSCKLEDS